MSAGEKKTYTKVDGSTGWRPYNKTRLKDPQLWKPGDKLTAKDEKLLESIRIAYKHLGYPPAKHDVPNAAAIKSRFRLWSDALMAAGIPQINDPEQRRKRDEAYAWKRRMDEILK